MALSTNPGSGAVKADGSSRSKPAHHDRRLKTVTDDVAHAHRNAVAVLHGGDKVPIAAHAHRIRCGLVGRRHHNGTGAPVEIKELVLEVGCDAMLLLGRADAGRGPGTCATSPMRSISSALNVRRAGHNSATAPMTVALISRRGGSPQLRCLRRHESDPRRRHLGPVDPR